MKNRLILLSMLPIMINYTTNAIPTKIPQTAGTLVVVTGAAIGFKSLSEQDESNKTVLAIGLASLAGGYITYRYLKSFTTQSKLEEAQNILKTTNESMQKDSVLQNILDNESIDAGALREAINLKYATKKHPQVTFFNKDLKPLIKTIEQTKKIIDSELNKYEESNSLFRSFENAQERQTLYSGLTTKQDAYKTLLEKLKNTATTMRFFEKFEEQLKECNNNKRKKVKQNLTKEKIQYYENQNSYRTQFFANNMIAQKIMDFILIFLSGYLAANGNQSGEVA